MILCFFILNHDVYAFVLLLNLFLYCNLGALVNKVLERAPDLADHSECSVCWILPLPVRYLTNWRYRRLCIVLPYFGAFYGQSNYINP